MNVRITAFLAIALAALLTVTGCNFLAPSSGTVSGGEMAELQQKFMSSYFVERGGRPGGARALTPFVSSISGGPGGSKATVPVQLLTNMSFTNPQPNPLAGYPEPGLSTSFTVNLYDAANHVYDVVVTTTYPATEVMSSYVEEYYIRDIGLNGSGFFDTATPDGV